MSLLFCGIIVKLDWQLMDQTRYVFGSRQGRDSRWFGRWYWTNSGVGTFCWYNPHDLPAAWRTPTKHEAWPSPDQLPPSWVLLLSVFSQPAASVLPRRFCRCFVFYSTTLAMIVVEQQRWRLQMGGVDVVCERKMEGKKMLFWFLWSNNWLERKGSV